MTPKEKAEELIEKFKFETKRSEIINDILLGDISVVFKHYKAKQCAIIAVDEIIQSLRNAEPISDLGYAGYWHKVKIEINKL
jgi:hypothetical protein